MKKNCLFLMLMLMLFSASIAWAEIDILKLDGIKNVVLLEEDIVSGGPPSEDDVRKAKAMGIKTVIDLRRSEKIDAEKVFVLSEDLKYFNIPVTLETLSRKQVDAVAEILSNPDNRPILLHCGSGNRVGALWALYSKFYKGLDEEEAYQEGLKKGMRSEGLKIITKKLLMEDRAVQTSK